MRLFKRKKKQFKKIIFVSKDTGLKRTDLKEIYKQTRSDYFFVLVEGDPGRMILEMNLI